MTFTPAIEAVQSDAVMPTFRTAFIGDSSLLIRCAESALRAGSMVIAVITKDARVRAWASGRGIPVLDDGGDVNARLAAFDFDYLFSVGHLDIIAPDVLRRARRMAINFHDGPLPKYAGLNAPSWALRNGETHHGVTWHEITEKLDAGRIVAAAEIAIEPDETALSLNAKCYETGLACFEDIVDKISNGTLRLEPQVGERSYFGRLKRPPAAATIDVTQPARAIAAQVRALHFGPYANPLGFAKLHAGDQLLLVGSAVEAPELGRNVPPGTILAIAPDSIVVATGTTPVRLEKLTDVNGAPVPSVSDLAGLARGRVLAPLPPELVERIDALNRKAATGEAHWSEALRQIRPFELPFPRARTRNGPVFHRFSLPRGGLDVDGCIAAFIAWTAKVAGIDQISLAYRSGSHDRELGAAAPWFSRWRPLSIHLEAGAALDDAASLVRRARREVDAAPPLACDLRPRAPANERALLGPEDLSIAIAVDADGVVDIPRGADLLAAITPDTAEVLLQVRASRFDDTVADVMAAQIGRALAAVTDEGSTCLADLELAGQAERELFERASAGPQQPLVDEAIPDLVAAQAQRTPGRTALRTRWETLTYAELQRRVDIAARRLARLGAGPQRTVAICVERSTELVILLLAVMRAGAAYLPLDTKYPPDRIAFMLADSQSPLVVTSRRSAGRHKFANVQVVTADALLAAADGAGTWTPPSIAGQDPAYLIYTSGSTGQPKGVPVSHRSVANFFRGMDAHISHEEPGTWLAVTGPSFDISVLELFWTLSRGFTVALHAAAPPAAQSSTPDFSLFYFAAAAPDEEDPYRLLFEGAKFADAHGFEAVWTPERHFHAFGGQYPNPAVTAAALAAVTSRVAIRAGSCVLPLHNPIRATEDWSVVDVISRGRVGLAIASGWQPTDFVLMPEAFADRKHLMLSRLADVRRLWRGEAVTYPGPDGTATEIRTLPRPMQKELPVWLTAARSPETFEVAGQQGYNVLTHLLGMSLNEVAENVRTYRAAWAAAGHPGRGRVTLMLHTFVGTDDQSTREMVREPMRRYLGSAMDLVRDAAWNFPTFVQRALQNGKSPAEIFEAEPLSAEELDALLTHAFNRYFETSGLFGSPDSCLRMIDQVAALGIDEIACLIDFGVATDDVLAQLPRLKEVKDRASREIGGGAQFGIVEDIRFFGATHLQCTPSLASMITADPAAAAALESIKCMMVGGEELPLSLARDLRRLLPARKKLLNMYGPTETTVWSTVCALDEIGDFIPLGQPIVNTTLRVAGPDGRMQPVLVPGELWIGGAGVAAGYWDRPGLTAERFVNAPRSENELMYRTGDLVRRHPDGRLEFLGRMDNQVKIRGHRIELGEIEAALEGITEIAQAVVVAREEVAGSKRLVAYYIPKPGAVCDDSAVRTALRERLPEIMIPAAYVRLAAFPLTPNGKVDRKALPAPTAVTEEGRAVSSDNIEAKIARAWREVLGLDQIQDTQDFFDLGGHSLAAVQIRRRLRAELACEISVTDIFRFPTVRSLAGHLGAKARLSARSDHRSSYLGKRHA